MKWKESRLHVNVCVRCLFYWYLGTVNVLVFADIRLHWCKMHPLLHMTHVHQQHFTYRNSSHCVNALHFVVANHLDAVHVFHMVSIQNYSWHLFICNILATDDVNLRYSLKSKKKNIWSTVIIQCLYWTFFQFLSFVLNFMIFNVWITQNKYFSNDVLLLNFNICIYFNMLPDKILISHLKFLSKVFFHTRVENYSTSSIFIYEHCIVDKKFLFSFSKNNKQKQ